MSRLTQDQAQSLAERYRIPLDRDFYTLRNEEVESVLAAADERRYRQPRNANGSRARYFHAALQRAALKDQKQCR